MAAADDAERLLRCLRRGQRSPGKPWISPSHPLSGSARPADRPQASKPGLRCLTPVNPDPQSSSMKECAQKIIEKNEITPGVFYGSPLGKPSKRPPQLARLWKEIRADLSLQQDVHGEAVWATFARQEQAIQYSDSHGNRNLAIFTYQDHVTGQRRFLATTYTEFWNRYHKMQCNLRHHYEIIREKTPCHLYFDVEFNRLACQAADGEAMVDLLLGVVGSTLHDVFSVLYEPFWTLELDSSTKGVSVVSIPRFFPFICQARYLNLLFQFVSLSHTDSSCNSTEKFSRHLVIRIPKAAFKDNSHVGAFVAEVCARIQILRGTDERFDQLYVMEGNSRELFQSKLFVDQAVYSRNRSFRLVFSSKAGKSAVLLPTYRFSCKETDDCTIFMQSLICKVDADCETLFTFGEEAAGHGGRLSFTAAIAKPERSGAFTVSGASPFLATDAFIQSISCVGDINGKIRSWYWFSQFGVIVYNISGNRFCERIGRQHKSNNVMYIVDFRTAGYYQKCHDPDCRGYKSPLRRLPLPAVPPQFSLSGCPGGLEWNQLDGYEDDAWWEEVALSLDKMDFHM